MQKYPNQIYVLIWNTVGDTSHSETENLDYRKYSRLRSWSGGIETRKGNVSWDYEELSLNDDNFSNNINLDIK